MSKTVDQSVSAQGILNAAARPTSFASALERCCQEAFFRSCDVRPCIHTDGCKAHAERGKYSRWMPPLRLGCLPDDRSGSLMKSPASSGTPAAALPKQEQYSTSRTIYCKCNGWCGLKTCIAFLTTTPHPHWRLPYIVGNSNIPALYPTSA